LGGAAGTLLGSRFGAGGAVVGGLIGRALTKEIATRTGNQIGNAISGGITPIVDKLTGEIRQGIDNFTGSIKNVVGSWTGLGGYNASAPYDNLVSTTFEPGGGVNYLYKNGDTLYEDAAGNVIFNKGTSDVGLKGFFNNPFGKNIDVAGPSLGAEYGSIWTDGSGNPILGGDGNYVVSGDLSDLGSINYGFDQADYLAGPDGDIWSDVDLVGIDSGDFASGIDDGFDFDSDFDWLDF
jgi:hypothetical protein